MQLQADYFNAYPNLKLTRDDKGVLVAEFHNNGGPFIMSAHQFRANSVDRRRRALRFGSAIHASSSLPDLRR